MIYRFLCESYYVTSFFENSRSFNYKEGERFLFRILMINTFCGFPGSVFLFIFCSEWIEHETFNEMIFEFEMKFWKVLTGQTEFSQIISIISNNSQRVFVVFKLFPSEYWLIFFFFENQIGMLKTIYNFLMSVKCFWKWKLIY